MVFYIDFCASLHQLYWSCPHRSLHVNAVSSSFCCTGFAAVNILLFPGLGFRAITGYSFPNLPYPCATACFDRHILCSSFPYVLPYYFYTFFLCPCRLCRSFGRSFGVPFATYALLCYRVSFVSASHFFLPFAFFFNSFSDDYHINPLLPRQNAVLVHLRLLAVTLCEIRVFYLSTASLSR